MILGVDGKCMLVIEQLSYDLCLHGPQSEQTSSKLCSILEDLYYPTHKLTAMSIQMVMVPSKKFSFWSSSLQVGHCFFFCRLSISYLFPIHTDLHIQILLLGNITQIVVFCRMQVEGWLSSVEIGYWRAQCRVYDKARKYMDKSNELISSR